MPTVHRFVSRAVPSNSSHIVSNFTQPARFCWSDSGRFRDASGRLAERALECPALHTLFVETIGGGCRPRREAGRDARVIQASKAVSGITRHRVNVRQHESAEVVGRMKEPPSRRNGVFITVLRRSQDGLNSEIANSGAQLSIGPRRVPARENEFHAGTRLPLPEGEGWGEGKRRC